MFFRQLILFSSNIPALTEFYRSLDFPVIEYSAETVSFAIGKSVLSFFHREQSEPTHFAITIPSNKIEDASNWVKQRVPVLKFKGREIVDFRNWNAFSVYFHDRDNNIVELIARKNLMNASHQTSFSPQQMVEISEVGIATDNIENIYNELNRIDPLPVFDGDFGQFCAAGDEHGLFIIIDKNKKSWMPVNEKAETTDFILKGDYNITFESGKINVLT